MIVTMATGAEWFQSFLYRFVYRVVVPVQRTRPTMARTVTAKSEAILYFSIVYTVTGLDSSLVLKSWYPNSLFWPLASHSKLQLIVGRVQKRSLLFSFSDYFPTKKLYPGRSCSAYVTLCACMSLYSSIRLSGIRLVNRGSSVNSLLGSMLHSSYCISSSP